MKKLVGKEKLIDKICAGFEDVIAYLDGDESRGVLTKSAASAIDVKAIRKKTGLTQEAFSRLLAIKPRELQDWEQDKKKPGASAFVFLTLIDQHPASVKKTLKTLGYAFGSSFDKKTLKPRNASTKAASKKKITEPKTLKNELRKQV